VINKGKTEVEETKPQDRHVDVEYEMETSKEEISQVYETPKLKKKKSKV
jgi:hypothetical protein